MLRHERLDLVRIVGTTSIIHVEKQLCVIFIGVVLSHRNRVVLRAIWSQMIVILMSRSWMLSIVENLGRRLIHILQGLVLL